MAIFDEPSKKPFPQPSFDDVQYASRKGLASIIPLAGGVASELMGLLSSPVAKRRDDWFSDLERRLRDLEGRIEGFRFDDLERNEQFVSATLQATQAALRTHQREKLDALRNAVLNIAVAKSNLPPDDTQLMFLNLIDRSTPTHLEMLSHIENRANNPKPQSALNNQVVQDLDSQGLLTDARMYVARNRDYSDLLGSGNWGVSSLGRQFLEFIKSP
jgi:hypothetical protein